jgi:hypothetical protein
MASAELSRRVEKVVSYPPLCEMAVDQRREFYEALLDADSFEDLPGKWQAAIVACRSCGSSAATLGRSSKDLDRAIASPAMKLHP